MSILERTSCTIRSWLYGLGLPFRSIRTILFRPRLIFLSALPTTLALLVYGVLVQKARSSLHQLLVDLFARWGWSASGWMAWGVSTSLEFLLILLTALSFSLAVGLLSIPLMDFLAEASETAVTYPLKPTPSSGLFYRLRLITLDAVKNILNLFLGIFFFFLGWIPGLHLIAWIFAAWLICLQFVSFAQTRRGQGVFQSMGFVFRFPSASLGFGMSSALMLSIPWVSCFFLPLLVVGGTQLFARATYEESLDGGKKLC